jgi:hypothetical protein
MGSEDELRVMVGKVSRLAKSLRPYTMDWSRPELYGPLSWYSPGFRITGNGLLWPSENDIEDTKSEIPISGNGLLWPWGLDNAPPTNKWLYKMLEKLMEPHLRSFPRGPYTCKYVLKGKEYILESLHFNVY